MTSPHNDHLRQLLRGLTTGLLWLLTFLPAIAAQAVIQPGEQAPQIELPTPGGGTLRLDAPATGVALLLFAKPGDRHTSAALSVIDSILSQHPQLDRGATRRMILSRIAKEDQIGPVAERAGPSWPLLLDRADAAYAAYRIIATPTTVIVGPDGLVAAVHAGYDPGMAHALRLTLASALGQDLPAAATQAAAPPNMDLQMARRLAKRGLWERALDYYAKLKPEDLTDEIRVEMASVLMELNRLAEATAALDTLTTGSAGSARAAEIRDSIQQRQARQDAPSPPTVTR